ncbi:MAG: M23 family metallopeptidase [Lachnospiraceae bacterium]|nr:M23 family metallopeptidase [Lachnospiraceae bacterium]
MKFFKIVKTVKQNRKLISFYTLVASTFVVAFISTGKNINVYSQPLPVAAVRYDTTKIYVPSKEAYDCLNQLDQQMDEIISQLPPEEPEIAVEDVNTAETKAASLDLSIPVGMPSNGPITSPFGDMVGRSSPHVGVDIGVSVGTPVRCTGSGTVIVSKRSSSYGYMVEIDHGNGYQTIYAHNSELTVSVGDSVTQGDIIALSGNTGNSTGPHLHYEMHYNGEVIDPLSN